jgi:hypothetical protein
MKRVITGSTGMADFDTPSLFLPRYDSADSARSVQRACFNYCSSFCYPFRYGLHSTGMADFDTPSLFLPRYDSADSARSVQRACFNYCSSFCYPFRYGLHHIVRQTWYSVHTALTAMSNYSRMIAGGLRSYGVCRCGRKTCSCCS